MGVDYSPVGGIGVKLTHEMKCKLIVANEGEAHDGCVDSLLGDLEFCYAEAGDGNYSGNENDFYLLVEGDTLMEINQNSKEFLQRLNSYGIKIKEEDLEVISELHVW